MTRYEWRLANATGDYELTGAERKAIEELEIIRADHDDEDEDENEDFDDLD